VDRQLVTQQMAALRCFDRIDVADDVRDGHVRRGEFFNKASVAIDPVDVDRVAVLCEQLPRVGGDRMKRIVVHFRARNNRNPFVQEIS
jgi:hypothetical protein